MRLYPTAFVMSFRRALRNPAPMIANGSFYIVLIVMFAALWNAITEATGGTIVGYTHQMMVCYLIASEGAYGGTRQSVIEEIGDDIRNRAVEAEMLRPVSVFWLRYFSELGIAYARTLSLIPIGVLSGLIIVGGFPDTKAALLAVIAMFTASACNVACQHIFGGAGFWINDVRPLFFVYQKLIFLIGCMLLPVQIFPQVVQTIIWCLPFWTMAYAPGRLASGHIELWLFAGQIAWLVVMLGIAVVMYDAGVRRLQRTGG